MATHGWRTGRTLKEQLLEEGSEFNYFQLIHLLERSYGLKNSTALAKNLSDLSSGNTKIADKEEKEEQEELDGLIWRVHADLDAAFPVSEISDIHFRSVRELKKRLSRGFSASLSKEKNSHIPQAVVAKTANYCIAGHLGPLPENYTEWIRDLQRDGNHALADFLDIFNHRINVLRYKAKRDSCLALDERAPEKNLLSPGISAAMGMLGKGFFEQLPLSRRSIMSLSGLMAGHRISAQAIQRVITACFGMKTKVTDVVGVWRDTAEDQIWKLGENGVSNLGEICILGQKNMDMQGKIRIEIGPLEIDKYIALLPDLHFSSKEIEVPVRSDEDLLECTFNNTPVRYKKQADNQSNANSGSTKVIDNTGSPLVDNVLIKYDERAREKVMSPSHIGSISVSRNTSDGRTSASSKLRATRFSGYLHRPFVAMLRYLTNSKVDIDVVMEVTPESLDKGHFALTSPERPQDAHLRLGQSFWLGKPSVGDSLVNSKSIFTVSGFESGFSSDSFNSETCL